LYKEHNKKITLGEYLEYLKEYEPEAAPSGSCQTQRFWSETAGALKDVVLAFLTLLGRRTARPDLMQAGSSNVCSSAACVPQSMACALRSLI
jgi:hypothetical protein